MKVRSGYTIYIIVLGLVSLLPFLAPLFLEISESLPLLEVPAKLIYLIYSFTCHQFDHRSFHIFDYQVAWCVRDVGIWLAIFLGALFTRLLDLRNGLRWYWVIPFVVLIALDGGVQTLAHMTDPVVPLYTSNNFVRFLAGAIFGTGVSLWLSPVFYEWFEIGKSSGGKLLPETIRKSLRGSMLKLSLALISLAIVFYVLVIGLWWVTGTEHLPTDALDSGVKNEDEDYFARRRHAVCPTSGTDFLNFDCFF